MENNITQIPPKTDPELDEINKDIQHYREFHFFRGIFSTLLLMLGLIVIIWLFLYIMKWR